MGHEGHSVRVGYPATATSAASKGAGNLFPRRSARRRIPAHAFAESEYLARCGPVVSKTSDNEHTLAPLGQSEELSVQDSVGPPIPEVSQRPEDGSKVPSVVA